MIDNYEMITPGHYFQSTKTGEMKKYDSDYMKYYNTMDHSMSKLRHNLLQQYVKYNTLCDFGYGDGNFLRYVQYEHRMEDRYKLYGHDISDYPLPYGVDFVSDYRNIDVDVITFFDSLEHIPEANLIPFLSGLKTKDIMISLPWCHTGLGPEWFKTWKHRKENEHFHHFDPLGLTQLLHSSGFTVIHISNDEDKIRKPATYLPNILTVIAKKR